MARNRIKLFRRDELRHNKSIPAQFSDAVLIRVTNPLGRNSTGKHGLGQFRPHLSITYINSVLALDGRTSTEKLVLFVLANHANEKGYCWPSFGTIGRECSLSRSAVIRTIGKLEKAGVIKREKRFPSNGYFLLVAVSHPLVAHGNKVVAVRHKTSSPKPPKPSVNHQEPRPLSKEESLEWKRKNDAALAEYGITR
jgi:hypothetical protein